MKARASSFLINNLKIHFIKSSIQPENLNKAANLFALSVFWIVLVNLHYLSLIVDNEKHIWYCCDTWVAMKPFYCFVLSEIMFHELLDGFVKNLKNANTIIVLHFQRPVNDCKIQNESKTTKKSGKNLP